MARSPLAAAALLLLLAAPAALAAAPSSRPARKLLAGGAHRRLLDGFLGMMSSDQRFDINNLPDKNNVKPTENQPKPGVKVVPPPAPGAAPAAAPPPSPEAKKEAAYFGNGATSAAGAVSGPATPQKVHWVSFGSWGGINEFYERPLRH